MIPGRASFASPAARSTTSANTNDHGGRDLNAPLALDATESGEHTEGSVFFIDTVTTLIRYGGVRIPTEDRLRDIPQRDPGIDLAMVHAVGTTLLGTVPLPEPRRYLSVAPERLIGDTGRATTGSLAGTPVRRGRDSCGRCLQEFVASRLDRRLTNLDGSVSSPPSAMSAMS